MPTVRQHLFFQRSLTPFSSMTGLEREIGVVVLEVHPATPEHPKEAMPLVGEGLAETAEESGLTTVGGEQE